MQEWLGARSRSGRAPPSVAVRTLVLRHPRRGIPLSLFLADCLN